jgi:phosphohistidine phosphatase SixA
MTVKLQSLYRSSIIMTTTRPFSSLTRRWLSSSTKTTTTTTTTTATIPPIFRLPKRIILLRHGESLGNVDDTAYSNIPDWKIPLTRRGERQALHAAKDLSNLLGMEKGESIFCYCSPYKRAQETWQIMQASEHLNHIPVVGTREEPRIAEQQFGNFQVRIYEYDTTNTIKTISTPRE